CADYVPAFCTHRPSLLPIGLADEDFRGRPPSGPPGGGWPKVDQVRRSRGRRSRNKVSVGEPADGSLLFHSLLLRCHTLSQGCGRCLSQEGVVWSFWRGFVQRD